MSPDMAPDRWNLRARISRADRYLSSFSVADLAFVIDRRLNGFQEAGLPPFERFEGPTDIFVDVALHSSNEYQYLHPLIGQASGMLLTGYAEHPTFEHPEVIAEAIFLAARIETESALEGISAIIIHHDAEKRLSNGEPLRSRALRAMFGLLAVFPDSKTEENRKIFERFKFEIAYSETCLAALTALYGSELQDLVNEALAKGVNVDRHQLQLQLLAVGFPLSSEG